MRYRIVKDAERYEEFLADGLARVAKKLMIAGDTLNEQAGRTR